MLGTRLGNWILDQELGIGGMGRVFQAHHEAGGQVAAVKVLPAELAREPDFQERFQREIEILRQLDHPRIVRFFEAGFDHGLSFYVMEYVEGPNFEELVRQGGRLSWTDVIDVALQICPALKHAHDRGIIHRDLKPANFLRADDGTVKLTDFGVARVFAGRQLTAAGNIVGTAEYLSPEQATGKPATKRSDLYSFGVVLYTLLTGRPPFRGDSMLELMQKHRYAQFDRPQRIAPDVPYVLEEVVCQLLEKDPAKRPGDAAMLQRQLESVQAKLDQQGRFPLGSSSASATQIYNPGTTALTEDSASMGELMREELRNQNRGGPVARFFNHPWVIGLLFLLVAGTLIWAFVRPGAEDAPGEGPTDDQAALERSVGRAKLKQFASEAQRLYLRGLGECREGDVVRARQTWADLLTMFRDQESERAWVQLAERGLERLKNVQQPSEPRRAAAKKAIQQIRKLLESGQKDEADGLRRALQGLYRDDPTVKDLLDTLDP